MATVIPAARVAGGLEHVVMGTMGEVLQEVEYLLRATDNPTRGLTFAIPLTQELIDARGVTLSVELKMKDGGKARGKNHFAPTGNWHEALGVSLAAPRSPQ